MRQPASWARNLCRQPRRLALGLRPRGRRPENVFIRSDKGAPCFHPAPGPAEAGAAGDGRAGSRTGPCVRPGWEGPILHPAADGPPVAAHGQTAWGRCAWLRKHPGAGWQAWNRRGEGSSTGGLAWSGPGPCLGAGQGRRGGRLSQRRDKPAAHARWPARFRGVSVTWRDAPPRHGATALPGHPASVPPPDESSSPQRRPPQVRQLAAVTERSASRPEAGYQQTDPSEVSWAGLGWP